MNKTIEYYNTHARAFTRDTQKVDFLEIQERFLAYLKKGDAILDLGCGAGRDSAYFIKKGFQVMPMDGSIEMCRIAYEYTHLDVRHQSFADLDDIEKYEGVWACASLLHVSKDELPGLLVQIRNALKPGGYLYVSFKEGTRQEERHGRFFADYRQEELLALMKSAGFDECECWKSSDVRAERSQIWINGIFQKKK